MDKVNDENVNWFMWKIFKNPMMIIIGFGNICGCIISMV